MLSSFEKKMSHLESLDNGKGVNYILNEGYRLLGNPIVMFDTSYNLLTYVDGVALDDPLWNEIISLGTFSHETVDFFNTENFIMTYAKSHIVSLMKSDKLKYDRMNGKLFDKDGVQLGNICVVACQKAFEEGDMELIEALCETLSVELQNSEFYSRIDRVYQESIFNDLIDGKIKDCEIAKTELLELRKELKTNLYLAVVDITHYEHTVTHLAYFRDLFRKILPEFMYYVHLNNIVFIMSTDKPMLSIERDLSELNSFFVKYKIYAGISSSFQSLMELRKRHREAICALNYGLTGMRRQQIFRYDNIRVERFLNSAISATDISEIYSPVVFLIQEYDSENNTTLLKLLYTYLLYGKDSALTCEVMGITESELNNQLKILEETFELDYKNGDMLFNIFISIKILEDLSS